MATPPTFTAGQVLTAAQMNKVGLWLISETTIGSSVASVTVSSAFSADYRNYLIVISNTNGSVNTTLNMQLDGLTTDYYYNNLSMNSGSSTITGGNGNNVTAWQVGALRVTTDNTYFIKLGSPFNIVRTTMFSDYQGSSIWYTGSGTTTNTASRTGFVLTPASGTISGGTIDVYGYNGA